VGGAAAAAAGFPHIRTAAAKTTTWRIQTSWPGGIGLDLFKNWCNGVVEKTGGELAFKPFGAKWASSSFSMP
jgi:TRAP-type mannitol/chloroaromatic compound transport system substrate-binding protein